MTQRNYNNVTTVGQLTGGVSTSATGLVVSGLTNTPAAPFTITVDRNTASEEICLVTAVIGSTLTVTRGFDSTAAQAHAAGATIEHTAVALDFTEANAHVNATTNVHGSTGALVDTASVQTVSGKTFIGNTHQADVALGDAVVAKVPTAAGVRNMFRGVGADGNDKFTVDNNGNVTGAGVSLTSLNTTVTAHTTSIAGKADKTYTDTQDTATLNSAKSYADSGDTTTLASAKSYTDSRTATPGLTNGFYWFTSQSVTSGSTVNPAPGTYVNALPSSLFSYASSTFTVTRAGVYSIIFQTSTDGPAAGQVDARINLTNAMNDGVADRRERTSGYAGAGNAAQTLTWVGFIGAGGTFKPQFGHTTSDGSSLTVAFSLTAQLLIG